MLLGSSAAMCYGSDDFIACQQAVASGSVMVGSGLAGDPAIPEPQSGYKLGKKPTTALSYMAVTANPLATRVQNLR
ncbi:MAG: hypothetical protein EBW20_09835 [Betaproteobacteria bacterium]|nr:hypothetical protein [Betaproteobacteria bacterium]